MITAPATVSEAVARAGSVAEEIALPLVERTDAGVWPAEALGALQRAALGGLVAPRSVLGSGLGMQALAAVCEELAQTCASTAICFGMHSVATAVLAAKATERQAKEFLAPIAAGEHLTSLAVSEPGTGGQFWLPQTELLRTASGLRVNGEKAFVTNGSHVDSYVVSAVAAEIDAPVGEFSCVLVPGDADGLTWLDDWDGIGLRGNSARRLRLRDVELALDNVLGSPGDQIWYVFEVIAPFFLSAMAGTYLGIAQASLDEVARHVTRRRHSHSGRALADEPIVQHRLGVLWAWVERTRRLVYWATEEADANGPRALMGLASAKAEVADCVVGVVNDAMTLVGGMGYRDRSPLERHLRDARAAHVMSPGTDVLRQWTGRALAGMPLLGN